MAKPAVKRKSVQEPAELTLADGGHPLAGVIRPLEFALLEPPVVEPEAVMFPPEDLEFISLTVAKDEETGGKGIEVESFFDQDGQAVDRFSKIGAA